jgi:ATP-dependent DNA helicase MPH1
MEGAESSPEPTPANMRIGTQGIDLGSNDTSGEEDEEEPDSELEAFVARSDDPIEMLSSSLPDMQQRPAITKKGGRLKSRAKPMPILMESDDEGEDSDETSKGYRAVADIEDDDGVVEISDMDDDGPVTAAAAAGRTKTRRVVQDSDTE